MVVAEIAHALCSNCSLLAVLQETSLLTEQVNVLFIYLFINLIIIDNLSLIIIIFYFIIKNRFEIVFIISFKKR